MTGAKENKPIPGQSHWCDGNAETTRPDKPRRFCGNIVANSSDHCAAGHENKIRSEQRPVLTDQPLTDAASPHEPSYEIHDLATSPGVPSNDKPEMSWSDRMRSREVGSIIVHTSEGVKPDCHPSASKGGITPREARILAGYIQIAAVFPHVFPQKSGARSWRVQNIVVSLDGTPGDQRLLIGGRKFTSEEACAFADRMEATATQLDDMNARIVRIQEFADSPTDQPHSWTDTGDKSEYLHAVESAKDDMRFLLGLLSR